jgi:hypothetical protein
MRIARNAGISTWTALRVIAWRMGHCYFLNDFWGFRHTVAIPAGSAFLASVHTAGFFHQPFPMCIEESRDNRGANGTFIDSL